MLPAGDDFRFMYDLRTNYGLEWLPGNVVQLLKVAQVAAKHKYTFLPHFKSYTRVDAEVYITVSRLPICMRDILEDRLKVLNYCWLMVKALLNALIDMEKAEVVVRNITPSTTFFSEDFS